MWENFREKNVYESKAQKINIVTIKVQSTLLLAGARNCRLTVEKCWKYLFFIIACKNKSHIKHCLMAAVYLFYKKSERKILIKQIISERISNDILANRYQSI